MKKDNCFNVLKVLATLLVVIAHVTVMYSSLYSAYEMPENMILDWISVFIYSFHMPLFLFISGSIFKICIAGGKYKSIKDFVILKFKRLMIPYLFIGISYVTPVMLLLKLTDESLLHYIIKGIGLCLDSRHLWYLYVLFIMFLITRVLKPVFERFPVIEYTVLLFAAVSAFYFYRYFPAYFGLDTFAKNYAFFLLGYSFVDKLDYFKRFPLISVGSSFVLINVLLFINSDKLRLFTGILGIIMSYSFAVIIQAGFEKTVFYKLLLKNSMGIYLFHPMIIYVLFHFAINWSVPAILFSFLAFTVALTVSIGLTKLLRTLHLGVLIGE